MLQSQCGHQRHRPAQSPDQRHPARLRWLGPLSSPVTSYQYDKASNFRFVTDPLGNVTEYVYDNLNRLVTLFEADPDGGGPLARPQWQYQYDAAGNLIQVTDPLARRTVREFDRLDRLVAVTQHDVTPPTVSVATITQGAITNEVHAPIAHNALRRSGTARQADLLVPRHGIARR